MEKLTLDLPTMYGDHHVIEVRRILLEMAGVEDVYASSAFQVVEVSYDATQINADAIKGKLEEAGYFEELIIPVEAGMPAQGPTDPDTFFRHTAAYAQTKKVVSFAQNVSYTGRPLWPCPGMGVVRRNDGED